MQAGKVVFACILGAFIGALAGLHFGHLWISILTGGAVGFLSYETPMVIAAIPQAWRQATDYQPNFSWISKIFKIWIFALGSTLNIVLGILALRALFTGFKSSQFTTFGWFEAGMFFFCSVIFTFFWWIMRDDEELKRTYLHVPILFWGWCIVWIAKHLPAAIGVLWNFARFWLRIIHSELRLLCMVDSAIGAAAGYCFHSPIIGAVVGGLGGLLNYEILSIRVLKLVPAEQSIFVRFR